MLFDEKNISKSRWKNKGNSLNAGIGRRSRRKYLTNTKKFPDRLKQNKTTESPE